MNHQQAMGLMAVEKYLLGELPPAERDEFEEHFFDCRECAADLAATRAFLATAKTQLASKPAVPTVPAAPRRARKSWLDFIFRPAVVSPVFAVLVLVIGYQGFTMHTRVAGDTAAPQSAQVLPSLSLINSRGGSGATLSVTAGQPFLLEVDIPAGEGFSSYSCELLAPSGARLWSISVTADQARDTVSIRVPAGTRPSGDYALLIRGYSADGAARDITRYAFTLTNPS